MKPESLQALGAIDLGAIGPGKGIATLAEDARKRLPDAIGKMAQVVVDNPGQLTLIAAGSMVATQMAMNLMKPRTPGQVLALFIVLNVALPKLAWTAVEKGWITFRVRDAEGNLVPLVIGQPAS